MFTLGLLLFFLFLCSVSSCAQQDCRTKVQLVERLFEEGQLDRIPPLLSNCLQDPGIIQAIQQFFSGRKDRLSRQDKIRMHRLLTIIYLEAQEDSLAHASFRRLLRLDPFHNVDTSVQSNPAELLYLYESFRTDPLLSISIFAGGNRASPRDIRTRGLFQGGATYGAFWDQNWGFLLSQQLRNRNYQIHLGFHQIRAKWLLFNDFGAFSYRIIERQLIYQFPIGFTYHFGTRGPSTFQHGQFSPFLQAGVHGEFIRWAWISQATRIGSNGPQIGGLNSSSDLKFAGARRSFNIGVFLASGMKVKIQRWYFFVNARYSLSIRNMVLDPYANSELVYRYGHVDSDKRLEYIAIEAGVEIPIFLPRLKP